MLSVSEAQALILAESRSFGTEKISLEKSFGRVLAQDVRADRDYPPFNRSMMDGFAIVAEQFSAQCEFHVRGTVFPGDEKSLAHGLSRGPANAIKIMTGAPVPAGFDAVIRKEDAVTDGENVRFTIASAGLWQAISRQGEDLRKDDALPLIGRTIDNSTASLLASLGIVRPQVAKLPKISIISTGNEIISPAKKPRPTQIRNANTTALCAQLAGFGIHRVTTAHAADDRAKLRRLVSSRAHSDILLLTGGVSAGDTDYVPEVLSELKYHCAFHKVLIKPGKPLWFGHKGKTVVFAIPGNPFSCQVIFKVFIEPYLRACFGMHALPALRLPLAEQRVKKDALEHYFPVRISKATEEDESSPLSALPFNGSGDVRAALYSDGIARQAADAAVIDAGAVTDFFPWRAL